MAGHGHRRRARAPTRCFSRCSTVVATSWTSSSRSSARLEIDTRALGRRTDLGHHPSDGVEHDTPDLPRYVAGPFPGRDYATGTYVGIFAIDVPGAARADHDRRRAPLVAAGADGPARVVATDVTSAPGAQRELVVHFTLPAGVRTMQIEPTARVPGVEWSDATGSWTDGDVHTVTW